ncbi:TIGR02301 family protein [Aurantimonas sp. VKM B-3413]|uniref:TIGR02301 family protein n=1 Tax=Aurantimonas sp. VKM B-3413 TaxID=2779401 RepID=UPI001E55294D|nr:TIGR02301 family protein [Aurantimonas sp. VKM B-3413]
MSVPTRSFAAPEDKQTEDVAKPDEGQTPSNAPWMKPLSRLASILGSMHFLRKLCGAEDANVWRDDMSKLIAAQAPNEADKRQLIASFNSGYRAFESTYRKCTAAARTAVNRYQTEGAVLAREIGSRYGT